MDEENTPQFDAIEDALATQNYTLSHLWKSARYTGLDWGAVATHNGSGRKLEIYLPDDLVDRAIAAYDVEDLYNVGEDIVAKGEPL